MNDNKKKNNHYTVNKMIERAYRRDENYRKNKILQDIMQKEKLHNDFIEQSKHLANKNRLLDIPFEVTIQQDYVIDCMHKRKYNEAYADYFKMLFDETNDASLQNISSSVRNCFTSWFFDTFRLQRVRNLKSINLCHNKFCSNCQHLLNASRLQKFTPVLDELQKSYDLYHCVLTIPNVTCNSGISLRKVIDDMFYAFSKVVRYFKQDGKIKNVDFALYGYQGAVRCLECTLKEYSFHPHLHCIFIFRKDLDLQKEHINTFSFDKGILSRKFSSLEILIQKIWYLLMNNTKVTNKSIESLSLGYSCTLDKIEGREYIEVFKYITKLTQDDNVSATMTYEQFKIMYKALYNKRTLQGYGCLQKVSLHDVIDGESVSDLYKTIIGQLLLVENPRLEHVRLDELVVDCIKNNYIMISKLQIQRYVNELLEDTKEDS